ncbi:hypothetical protein T06_9588 [Trichinella sp. T6]|nr:hypothetical protein T06_9588 [Trichinella sp. T6]
MVKAKIRLETKRTDFLPPSLKKAALSNLTISKDVVKFVKSPPDGTFRICAVQKLCLPLFIGLLRIFRVSAQLIEA